MKTQAAPRYTILFDIASGGMGVVSVAQLRGERGFRKTVAVKRIHSQLAKDQAFFDLLAREARLCSQLQDPGIVQVHELVQQDQELMLAMELVEGTSLKELMRALEQRNEPFPIHIAVHILQRCASALHSAHIATDETGEPLGIIHRDVSPQNVLISYRGSVKVMDFGIAKAMAGDEVTRTDSVRGKPSYLAPEQSIGGHVDARSDIWALGVVGWELLTGQRLFKGRNDLETLHLLMEGEIPRVDAVRPDVPPEVADAIDRCLQRDASARFETAEAMADALESSLPREKMPKREELSALVSRALPGAHEAFTAQIRAALASQPRAEKGNFKVVRPLRIAAMAALGFVISFGGRAAIGSALAPSVPEAAPVAEVAMPTPAVVQPSEPIEDATQIAEVAEPVIEALPVVGSPEGGDEAPAVVEATPEPRGRRPRRNEPRGHAVAQTPAQTAVAAQAEPPHADPPRETPRTREQPHEPPPQEQTRFITEFPL